jgi:hypothetical protein
MNHATASLTHTTEKLRLFVSRVTPDALYALFLRIQSSKPYVHTETEAFPIK